MISYLLCIFVPATLVWFFKPQIIAQAVCWFDALKARIKK